MEPLGLVFTVIATVDIAAYTLYRRYLRILDVFSEKELLVGQCVIASAVCALLFLSIGEWWNELAPEYNNASVWWIALAATTAANVVIQFTGMRVAGLAEASFAAPISAMTPGLVLMSAILIGEHPTSWGIAGIALIVIGVYGHAREGESRYWWEYVTPLCFWLAFRNMSALPEKERGKFVALRWSYIGALFATVGLLGDGLVARHGDMLLAVTIELGALAVVYAAFVPNTERTSFFERLSGNWERMATFGVLFAVPFALLGVGFRLAPIADVGSLKRLAIVLTVVGGALLLGEVSGKRRTVFAIIVTIGALLIANDPAPAVVIGSLGEFLRNLAP